MASSAKDDLFFQDIGDTGVITINRPQQTNAFSLPMILSLIPVLEDWDRCKKLVIIKSRTPMVFASGGDVLRVAEEAKLKEKIVAYYSRYGYKAIHLIASMKIPFVSLNNGLTIGGGAGICMYSKYFVCTENTDLVMPECRIGAFVDVCSSYLLSRLKNHLGIYLALTGSKLKSYDNVCAGLATHFCRSEKLPQMEKALLGNPEDVESIIESFSSTPENAKFSLEPYLPKIDRYFSADTVEEIIERLQKDGSRWCEQTVATMRQMCPLSLKVTLRQLQRARTSTLEECVQREYVLANSLFAGENFIEGIRARLKDQDNKPAWYPSTLAKVTPEMVEKLFEVEPLLGKISLRPKESQVELQEEQK